VLECVANNGDGSYTAYFGYKNDNSGPVAIPVGGQNKFSPNPAERGQPTVFQPGRQVGVFSVLFNGSNLVWTLNGRMATASTNPAQACPGSATATPTSTAMATLEPTATATPIPPTETATPEPTATDTSTPEATATETSTP
jgi:hypothetical protein